MKLIAPEYYTDFHCIAERCRHSCCVGWEIAIDAEKLAYYRSIQGKLGERLQKGIVETEEEAAFLLDVEERCPFLNKNGLCDLITALGEDSLCQICRDHPRYRNFYADRTEIGLGLCCEAAGALILNKKEKTRLVILEDDGGKELPDVADESLLAWREELFLLAQDRAKPIERRAVDILQAAGLTIFNRSWSEWAEVYLALERLEKGWTERLREWQETEIAQAPALDAAEWELAFEQLLVYFLYRQMPFALDDGEYEGRAAFAVLSYAVIRQLCLVQAVLWGGVSLADLVEIARQYSAEIEYSDENIAVLLYKIQEEW
nr:flagellin lysine-N-methylase [uncultured Anaerotignum sp.]